jgi:hypothetical protein
MRDLLSRRPGEGDHEVVERVDWSIPSALSTLTGPPGHLSRSPGEE